MNTQISNDMINGVLQGEYAAIESYDKILFTEKNKDRRKVYKKTRMNHVDAIKKLRKVLTANKVSPESSSGIWGDVVSLITNIAKELDQDLLRKAILKGEENGLQLYQDILKSDIDEKTRIVLTEIVEDYQKRNINRIKKLDS